MTPVLLHPQGCLSSRDFGGECQYIYLVIWQFFQVHSCHYHVPIKHNLKFVIIYMHKEVKHHLFSFNYSSHIHAHLEAFLRKFLLEQRMAAFVFVA